MKVTKEQQKKGEELYERLIQKAWESASFKEKLINTPHLAIESFTGKSVNTDKMESDKVMFKVEDQTNPNIIYLNIPQKIDLSNIELTPEQLDMVSGGDGFWDGVGYAIADKFISDVKLAYAVGEYLWNKI